MIPCHRRYTTRLITDLTSGAGRDVNANGGTTRIVESAV